MAGHSGLVLAQLPRQNSNALLFLWPLLGLWTAVGFVQVRHENLALLLAEYLSFWHFATRLRSFHWLRNGWRRLPGPVALLLVIGNLMWILALTLRLINVDRMTENTEEALLSFGHLLNTAPFLESLVQGSLD